MLLLLLLLLFLLLLLLLLFYCCCCFLVVVISEFTIVAVYVCRSFEQRMKVCDDGFREQLEAKDAAHHDSLRTLAAEKQKQVDLANHEVIEMGASGYNPLNYIVVLLSCLLVVVLVVLPC